MEMNFGLHMKFAESNLLFVQLLNSAHTKNNKRASELANNNDNNGNHQPIAWIKVPMN